MLILENANTVIGRLSHDGRSVQVEHAILAGSTMAAVEVQSTVWTVGWTAISFAPRIRALLQHATPVPVAPETPAALRRDAADHVRITNERVQRFLSARFGEFQHDPDWGFHGPVRQRPRVRRCAAGAGGLDGRARLVAGALRGST